LLIPDSPNIIYTPEPVPFDDDGLASTVDGFEGFEAIAFWKDNVFATIESSRSGKMMGYLVRGKVIPSGSSFSIQLDATTRIALPPRADLINISDEAIVILPNEKLLTFYEANGANVVPNPFAYLFDISGKELNRLGTVPVPNIEYRISDCTPADSKGNFWCINYMYPGDHRKLNPARDVFAERRATDPSQSHAASRIVERLIELRFDGKEIVITESAPIELKLDPAGVARNWESIAYVRDRGFFLATDKYHKTLFAFIPWK
jgi:hypothetical protein